MPPLKLTYGFESDSFARKMRSKVVCRVFSLLFLSGALALYSDCSEAAPDHDFGAEHEASSIHCPNAAPHSNIRATSTIQSPSKNPSNIPPGIDEKTLSVLLIDRVEDHPFREPISRQGLFRFKEVYRL